MGIFKDYILLFARESKHEANIVLISASLPYNKMVPEDLV